MEHFPVNARFAQLCLSLEIEPNAEQNAGGPKPGSLEYYKRQLAYVSDLLRNSYSLEGDTVRFKKLLGQGPAVSLHRELTGEQKLHTLKRDPAEKAVRCLMGFVHCAGAKSGWAQVPRRAKHELEPGAAEPTKAWSHPDVYSVVPARVREKIYDLWIAAPNELERYVAHAINYLEREGADPLQEPPWKQPFELEHGHELILDFLNGAKDAASDITVVAVTSFITASIGGQVFLGALKRGVNVRFLLFDFLKGDVEQVARMIRRSPDALRVSANDTMEALLLLRDRARAEDAEGKLELRLAIDDPQGRWYIVDARGEPNETLAFVVPRIAGAATKAASAAAERVSKQAVEHCVRHVEALWAGARPIDRDWLTTYERWKSGPEIQSVLGQN
jgi:hypothetical protein